MSDQKQYAERDIDGLCDHYYRHISAMTGESLHSKSRIAAELAYRDGVISELQAFKSDMEQIVQQVFRLSQENARLKESQACGPEAVAAQQRFRHPQRTMPDWSVWQSADIRLDRPSWALDSQGYEVEYRLLYAAPSSASSQQLLEAIDALIKADEAEAWRHPTVWEPIIAKARETFEAQQVAKS